MLKMYESQIVTPRLHQAARLGYGGAMRVSGKPGSWGTVPDPNDIIRLLRNAVEIGVSFIDTADSYGPAMSESLIAAALWPYPPGLTIATKGGVIRNGDSTQLNGRPNGLRAACEASLKRLRLDRIDLYQLHWLDQDVPIEDQLGALADLRRAGKIDRIGLCNVDIATIAAVRRLTQIASVQNPCSLGARGQLDIIGACARRGITFIASAPLAILRNNDAGAGSRIAVVARRHGATIAQIVLAWLLHLDERIIVIPGTLSASHLRENMGSSRIMLDAADLAALADLSPAVSASVCGIA